jgi:hypothetical protein
MVPTVPYGIKHEVWHIGDKDPCHFTDNMYDTLQEEFPDYSSKKAVRVMIPYLLKHVDLSKPKLVTVWLRTCIVHALMFTWLLTLVSAASARCRREVQVPSMTNINVRTCIVFEELWDIVYASPCLPKTIRFRGRSCT